MVIIQTTNPSQTKLIHIHQPANIAASMAQSVNLTHCRSCGAPQSAWRSLDVVARTSEPAENNLIDLSADVDTSDDAVLLSLSEFPELRCLEGPLKKWTDWLVQVVLFSFELSRDCSQLGDHLQELVTVLYLCRRASCPLLVQESVRMIASICDHVTLAIGRAIESVCVFLDLLAATDNTAEVSQDALRASLLSAWPEVARLDFDLLNRLCNNIDDYLAKHVEPVPTTQTESTSADSSCDDISSASLYLCVLLV